MEPNTPITPADLINTISNITVNMPTDYTFGCINDSVPCEPADNPSDGSEELVDPTATISTVKKRASRKVISAKAIPNNDSSTLTATNAETFYKIADNDYALIISENGVHTVVQFNNNFCTPSLKDPEWIHGNALIDKSVEPIFQAVKDKALLEVINNIEFFIDKRTFKIGAIINGLVVDLDSPDAKEQLVKEKKKMKDVVASLKKTSESYRMGDRVLLYGPTGTGKTYNFLDFINKSKLQYAVVPVSEGMEDIDLLNYIVPTGTGVAYKAKEITNLLERAEKGEKVVIIFDELNRGSNSLMNLVLKALDPVDGKNYYINNVLQDRMYVIPQENVIWGATINLGGKYTGTNALDEALFDRFNIVSYAGYDPDVEKALIKATGISDDQSKQLIKFVSSIREFATGGQIRSPISTRGIKVWLEEFMNTGDLRAAFERTILYRLVNVDEFGTPNKDEISILQKTFVDTLKGNS